MKILPLYQTPVIAYLDYAFSFSIMLNNPKSHPWFYSNFIQLFFDSNSESDPLRFFYLDHRGFPWQFHAFMPFLDYKIIPRSMFRTNYLDINKLIVESIECDNRYVVTSLDEFYIPGCFAYDKRPFPHATLIYGYDDEGYYVTGFRNNIYKYKEHLPFEVFNNSFFSNANNAYYMKDIQLIDYPKWQDDYNLDIQNIIDQCNDYLNSVDSALRNRTYFNSKDYRYGIGIYDGLIDYYLLATSVGKKNYKPLHLLWEHKKLMVLRITYLLNNNISISDSVINDFKRIEREALIARNLYLKMLVDKNTETVKKICNILKQISISEKSVMDELINQLEKINSCTKN